MTLHTLFDLSLIGRRSEQALEYQGISYTFGEIDSRASRMANLFTARGLRPGDRICVYLANCVEYIDLFLAATRLGVIFVPINILYRDLEIRHILKDAEPKALITTPIQAAHVATDVPVWLLDEIQRDAAAMSTDRLMEVSDGDTPAAIVYTSGTTGAAKGAVLTHNNFAVNAVNLVACWRFSSSDRLHLTLPLFHVHGLGNGLHCWLASGCHMRLEERFAHDQTAQWMLDYRPTVFFGVPAMYVRMLEWSRDAARSIGAAGRLFVSGSAPLAAQVHREFETAFGHTILERYGMSETLMNLSNPYANERRPGTVGMPLPGVSVRNADRDGNPVPDGVTGELFLKGPNLFAGYWRQPEATRQAFHDGWFRTGDIAVRSPDGYYTLHGRRTDLIISGGFNIYPREIEEFLVSQPDVTEAAVAGVPHPRRGEIPVAYVAGNPGLNIAALETACRAHMASFKVPRAFIRVDKLPRTALGKVQKHLLPTWEQQASS